MITSLIAPPIIWAAHFLLSYITAAIWCAKVAGPAGSLRGGQIAIAIYTVAALAAIAVIGVRAAKRRVPGTADDHDSADARVHFVALATLLLVGLSAIAILYGALATALVGSCR